jgi:ribosome biogenesis GTPase
VEKEELPLYFSEFGAFAQSCRFQPCLHIHEPDCAVKEAVG